MSYAIRLDDAAPTMDVAKWGRVEDLLDRYSIRPLVGIIPFCKDPMFQDYGEWDGFWDKAREWKAKGWAIALHGYNHVYTTECAGINPVHRRSEFAGVPLDKQASMLREGEQKLIDEGVAPTAFFAPSHTFDENTLSALYNATAIRVVSDTVAWDAYRDGDFAFVPVQSGRVRRLPFKLTTFCYHPNFMSEGDFFELESFLDSNGGGAFVEFPPSEAKITRRLSPLDRIASKAYFALKRLKGSNGD